MASIEKRVSAKGVASWRVVWRHGGSRQSLTEGTQAAARRARAEVERHGDRVTSEEVRRVLLGVPARAVEVPTFGEAADDWFATRTGVKPQTVHTQRVVLRRWLSGWLDLPVTDIDTDDAATLVNRIEAEGRDPRPAIALGKAVLNRQRRKGVIAVNPFEGVKASPREAVEKGVTEAEARLVIDSAPEALRLLCWLGWETGVRIGEACALKPSDLVDPLGEAPMLSVQRTATRGKRERWEALPPKNGKGRTIAIPRDLAKALHAAGQGREWLFPAPEGGMCPPATMASRWRRAQHKRRRAGLRAGLSFHDLRHGHATYLLDNGVGLADVSYRLGHSSKAFTANTYIQRSGSDDRIRSLFTGGEVRRLRAV